MQINFKSEIDKKSERKVSRLAHRDKFSSNAKQIFFFKSSSSFFLSIESFFSFFNQFYPLIFGLFWISIHNLFWFVLYGVITVSNKCPCILLMFYFVSIYFSYYIIKSKTILKNKVTKPSEVHNSGCRFDGLSCETRVDIICCHINIKKKYISSRFFFSSYTTFFYRSSRLFLNLSSQLDHVELTLTISSLRLKLGKKIKLRVFKVDPAKSSLIIMQNNSLRFRDFFFNSENFWSNDSLVRKLVQTKIIKFLKFK